MEAKRQVRVFIASPGDLALERQAFKDEIDDLNQGFGDGAGIHFLALGWEDTLATTGRRLQSVINREVDTCDVFVLALHRRWGQSAPDTPFSSYTEEEFHRALQRFEKSQCPEIFVFFRNIDAASLADPGPHLTKVLAFRAELERTRATRYRIFADSAEFRREISRHLRAYVKGVLPPVDLEPLGLPLPVEMVEQVHQARQRADLAEVNAKKAHDVALAAIERAESLAAEVATQAAQAAREGRIEEARQAFAKATVGTTNLQVLSLAVEFYIRLGEFHAAEDLLERSLAVAEQTVQRAETANGLRSRGRIAFARGELDAAEQLFHQALLIYEALDHHEGMADAQSDLGMILESRGDLQHAETMYRKALGIDERLGNTRGIAKGCINLSSIYQARGELELAEARSRRALTIYTKLGDREGEAEARLGIGAVDHARGDLDRARQMYRQALSIFNSLGHREGLADTYSSLGLLHQTRGELSKAEEECYRPALLIYEGIGHRQGLANTYTSLGEICEKRGQLARATEFWTQARDLFVAIGLSQEVEQLETLLEWVRTPSDPDAQL